MDKLHVCSFTRNMIAREKLSYDCKTLANPVKRAHIRMSSLNRAVPYDKGNVSRLGLLHKDLHKSTYTNFADFAQFSLLAFVAEKKMLVHQMDAVST